MRDIKEYNKLPIDENTKFAIRICEHLNEFPEVERAEALKQAREDFPDAKIKGDMLKYAASIICFYQDKLQRICEKNWLVRAFTFELGIQVPHYHIAPNGNWGVNTDGVLLATRSAIFVFTQSELPQTIAKLVEGYAESVKIDAVQEAAYDAMGEDL